MFTKIKGSLWRFKTSAKIFFDKISQRKPTLQNGEVTKNPQNLDTILVSNSKPKNHLRPRHIKYISRVLTSKEKTLVYFFIFVIIACSGFLAYRYYTKHFIVMPASGGEYSEGLIGAPRYINPLLAQTNDVDLDLTRLIFSGLLAYDKNLKLVEDMAEKYTVSDDQKIYTFTLKKNIFWHDGEALTADDIVFTYQSAQDPQFKSPLFYSLRGVKVEKKDDQAVVFTLDEPFQQFLEILTTGILPAHLWKNIPSMNANLTEYNIKPIGSGAWKYESFIRDKFGNVKSYTLAPNDTYYGKKPYLKKITFKFYSDYDPINDIYPAIEALNNRKVDAVSYIPKNLKNKIQNPLIRFYSLHLPQYTALFFNQKNNSLLKEKYIRQAVAMAIDKTSILTEALNLEGEIVNGPMLRGYPGYDNNIKKISFDPQRAMEILDENGWKEISKEAYDAQFRIAVLTSTPTSTDAIQKDSAKDNEKKTSEPTVYRVKNKQILKIKLTAPDLTETMQAAQLVQKYLQNIGIMADLEIVDDTSIVKDVIRPRNYEALLYGEIIGSDPDPYPFWHSSQNQDPGLNLAIFTNRNIDKALEDAKKAKTQEEKNSKYFEFQNLIADDLPAIFLYSPTYTYALHEKIKGVSIERILLPSDRFNNINEWYTNTRREWDKK